MNVRTGAYTSAVLALAACSRGPVEDATRGVDRGAKDASGDRVPSQALLAVWADTNEDVWAVGDSGTIVHYDGQSWATVPSGTTLQLSAVHGTAPDDVWAVGESGIILHYDGKVWAKEPRDPNTNLLGVWTGERDNVWVAGIATDDNLGYLRHWDGSLWEGLEIPVATSLWEVWGTDSTNVWMVGTSVQGMGLVLKGAPSQGDAGHPVMNFEALEYTGSSLRGVWGTSPDDVWVAEYEGTIQEWDGTSWHSDTAPATGLLGLWGAGPNDVWAVGLSGAMVHGDGQAWSESPGVTKRDLWSVSGTDANDAWAVGADGTILRWDGDRWRSALVTQ